MKFWKYHGLGNDYILFDKRKEDININRDFIRKLCNRKFGIGADGVLVVEKSKKADFRMRIFNSDGSEAGMCGNGIRCFGKYLYDYGLTSKKELEVETLAGIKKLNLFVKNGKVSNIRVGMGRVFFKRSEIPVVDNKEGTFMNQKIETDGEMLIVSCVSVGNPHAVIFTDNLDLDRIKNLGSKIENHPYFPNRINVEFVKVISRKEIKLRVWERGVGVTLACGTGACAASAVGVALKKLVPKERIQVHMDGGDLRVIVEEDFNQIYLEGPTEEVFRGELK